MVENTKRPKLVGNYIRQKREEVGLSQRALGLMFNPPVTTQFISNVERGVTPLPPNHIPTLTKALQITEAELLAMMEKEYTAKLSGRLGKDGMAAAGFMMGYSTGADSIPVSAGDKDFIRSLYDAYKQADNKTKQTFMSVCESILNLPRGDQA